MVVLVRIVLHFLATLRAAPELGGPLVYRVGLPLQRLVEHLLGEDEANGPDGVLDGAEFGAPGGTFVALEAIDQTLGDAFEIGTDGVSRGGRNREVSHPGTFRGMRVMGNLERECTTRPRFEANPSRDDFPPRVRRWLGQASPQPSSPLW